MVSSRRFRNAVQDLEDKIEEQNREEARDTTLALECSTDFMSADNRGAHLRRAECKVIIEEPYKDDKTVDMPEFNRAEIEAENVNLIGE